MSRKSTKVARPSQRVGSGDETSVGGTMLIKGEELCEMGKLFTQPNHESRFASGLGRCQLTRMVQRARLISGEDKCH